MNTKNKIIAILMASIVAMAVGVPMAMSAPPTTSATVGNVAPTVSVSAPEASVSLTPCSAETTITISATVTDANGYDDIDNSTVNVTSIKNESGGELALPTGLSKTMSFVSGSGTSASYTVTINLSCCTPKGQYTVEVEAKDDASVTCNNTDTFNVSATPAVQVGNMVYQDVDPGNTTNGNHTVSNMGNVAINFTELTTAGYDNDGDNDGITWIAMTNTTTGDEIPDTNISTTWNQTMSIAAPTGSACDNVNSDDVPFSLAVPVGILPATYTGTTTFTPQEA